MPFGSGQKSGYERNEFEAVYIEVDGINTKVKTKEKCKHCSEEVSNKIERLRQHLQKCRHYKSIEPERIEKKRNISQVEDHTEDKDNYSNINLQMEEQYPSTYTEGYDYESGDIGHNRHFVQKTLKEHVIVTTPAKKKVLDMAVAKFFFANAISFNASSSLYYTEMFDAIRPGYRPPNRKQLADTLLTEAAADVTNEMQKQLTTCAITLLQDGWSSIRNDPIIASSIHTGTLVNTKHKTFLLSTKDCGSEAKTADYCTNLLKADIELIKKDFNNNVFAICTDNENKMLLMRQKIKIEYPDILVYGCNAHYLNLLENELTPKTILCNIEKVQKYFRNHHKQHGWLKEKNGLSPQISNCTRWNSQVATVDTFIKNFYKYQEINNQYMNEMDKQISRILNNIGLYREALNLQEQLVLVGSVLNKMQGDSTSLSSALDGWLDLLYSPVMESYVNQIQKRMDDAVEPFFLVAYWMDPFYMGSRLNVDDEERAETWIIDNKPNFLPAFLAFKAKDETFFPSSMFNDLVLKTYENKPGVWWNLMSSRTAKAARLPPDFCSYFSSLLSVPPSSASLERIFSTFGLMWTKLRNRLGHETAAKLVKVHRFLNVKSNQPNIDVIDACDDFNF